MTMQMKRAFNSRMLVRLYVHSVSKGSYDEDNIWVEGIKTRVRILGVITVGNKFSRFDEGISRRTEDGGYRTSDYRNVYVLDKDALEIDDKLEFRGVFYNVLQESDEGVFGFRSFILEKSKGWKP